MAVARSTTPSFARLAARGQVGPACVCALLAVGTAVVIAAPVQATGAFPSQTSCVRWAAQPVTPVAGARTPHPSAASGTAEADKAQASSPADREISIPTMRRAARTRMGGRLGP